MRHESFATKLQNWKEKGLTVTRQPEQDSEKLIELVVEINRMLDEKEQRLKRGNLATPPADPKIY